MCRADQSHYLAAKERTTAASEDSNARRTFSAMAKMAQSLESGAQMSAGRIVRTSDLVSNFDQLFVHDRLNLRSMGYGWCPSNSVRQQHLRFGQGPL
jgi:hypothetical protein